MDRRAFLRDSAATLGGLAALDALPLRAAPAPRPDLAVAHGASPERIVRAAVDALGGIRRFIAKGDVVVVKPNIGWDRTPEQAACTNPEVVATLVRLCLEAGAKTVKVFDRTCNDARRCYVQSGIEAAARAAGAEVSHIDERRFREVKIPRGVAIQAWPIYIDVLEADKLINVPIAKHHSLGRLTLSLKNWMGVMGENRGRIHQRLDETLVDIATVVRPCLTVLDAVRILTAHGPVGGNLADVKRLDTVVAGTDQIAVDAYGATLFGLTGADLGYVREGARRGLGVMDLGRLVVKKLEA
ncbi:DUF362 domain-containing protein [Geothrix sp. 21YS21S-2]|uniref:DUF362 domain-containing protein n=1 Tax=Geothrix sp. 21YS21S-2 TaxID=3068893 RepID=UPI0027BA7C43|nr:DUF362 domain-containing protein [Geothrix sp. 21YS21S-2]